MKKIISLIVVIFFILSNIGLYIHYQSWGSSSGELIPFISFISIAEIIIFISILVFKQFINPLSVYCMFICMAGFSFINLADKQTTYSLTFLIVLILSIMFFVLGSITSYKTKTFTIKAFLPKLSSNLSLIFILGILGISGVVFLSEIKQLGYLPILNLGNTALYDDLVGNEISSMHNFIVLNSILPAIYFIFYKGRTISLSFFLILTIISFFIILNFFSRQIIILFFISLLLAYNFYYKIPFYKLLIVVTICTIIFVALGELRTGGGVDSTADAVNETLKFYSGIHKPTNLLETYLSLYGGVNFSTGEKLVSLASLNGYISWGKYSIRPIISILPIDKQAIYPVDYSSYTQLGTYIVDPYLDFRYFGVIFLNFSYGFFSTNSFKNYLKKASDYYIIEWALFVFCIFMCSFTNFFHMFFIVFFFIINRLAIK